MLKPYLPTPPVASGVFQFWRASPSLLVRLDHSHISHLPVLPHFRDRSPCTACNFMVNRLRKTCARYCIWFAVFYYGDKTSGYLFTSFVRGDLLSRWRYKEHTMVRPWFLLVIVRKKKEYLPQGSAFKTLQNMTVRNC